LLEPVFTAEQLEIAFAPMPLLGISLEY